MRRESVKRVLVIGPQRCNFALMNTKLLFCFSALVLFSSCAQDSMTGDTYSRSQAGQAQTVTKGRITSIRPVKIEGGNTAGTIIGGVAGGLLGSNIGQGRASNTAGAVGGALVGGVLGSHAQQSIGSRNGIEITVLQDQGGSVSVVQQVSANEPFSVGDRVRVLSSGSGSRVAF
jgi:outer membrane lipoprotein SlyB